MKNPINKKVRIAFNVLSGIMLVVLMLMVGVILFQRIATGEPRVFGYQFYVILTDSMSPELVPGDVILSKEVTPEELKVGDYVTYKPERGRLKGHNVTHRLERFETSEEGELMVVTRGIIEGATEDYPVPATAVKTKMVSKLKFTSTLFNVLKTPYGFIFLIVLPLLVMMSLLIYNYMKTSGKQKAERDSEAEKKELAKQKYLEELKKSGISADGAHDKKE